MLPERRKRLIITIVGIVLFCLLVVSIYAISNYVKEKTAINNKDIDDRANGSYPKEYTLYGITVDMENILRIYGIDSNYFEKYIGVRSFYKDQSEMIKDNHLFIYTDCVNELRYDDNDREFYLYKYDEYYSNNTKIKLSKNNIIMFDKDNNVITRKYNSDDIKTILNNISYDNVLVKDNHLYYVDDTGIHKYNLNNDVKDDLFIFDELDHNVKLIRVNDNYLVFTDNNEVNIYINNTKEIVPIINMDDIKIEYLELVNDGYYFQIPNLDGTYSIKKYSLVNSRLENEEFITKFKVKKMSIINNNLCYMDIIIDDKEESILFSLKIGDIVKKLDNKYIYIADLDGV